MTAELIDAERALVRRIRDGDRRALAAGMTQVQRSSAAGRRIVAELVRVPRRAAVLGVTGPPGAGKSTLVGSLVTHMLARDRRVGVLLIDPSSPTTGGALLADRVRMKQHIGSPELYVRSVASRGHAGGLSSSTTGLVRLLDAWGAELIIIETVGAGQGEIEVCRTADATLVICPPGLGDDLQAMKAGVMEVADLFVVNKADQPGARSAAAALAHAGSGGRRAQRRRVILTTATTGEGISELIDELDRLLSRIAEGAPPAIDGGHDLRSLLAREAANAAHHLVMTCPMSDLADILSALTSGRLDLDAAGRQSLKRLVGA